VSCTLQGGTGRFPSTVLFPTLKWIYPVGSTPARPKVRFPPFDLCFVGIFPPLSNARCFVIRGRRSCLSLFHLKPSRLTRPLFPYFPFVSFRVSSVFFFSHLFFPVLRIRCSSVNKSDSFPRVPPFEFLPFIRPHRPAAGGFDPPRDLPLCKSTFFHPPGYLSFLLAFSPHPLSAVHVVNFCFPGMTPRPETKYSS